ncbi:hypothetical protein [Roseovarius indicus]|uniref:Uncharacterized protein n=2 Tax=Roseovarius indicus TaxID=540747 RepID=A0A0T5PAJ3_9RHOB|nr:hypothetical protein [Roseovarius indicus]KRS18040.1 hypothetical protein XM52_10860 [Roseovarius indicus]OAO02771.1 hypothetical protein A8B76_05380 [Roseovarius indicus]QEW27133.1 hypothetical protein RIdsm_02943 [Roseovarius indicus]SFD53586.1 hypothetical protein SAMN04488031_101402 [Roseovarius indicus]
MNPRWLFRMAKWAQRPPSEKRVKLVLGVIVLCLLLVAIEYFIGWPDWMTVEPAGRRGWLP